MASSNLYSQAVTTYRILLDPALDPWTSQTRLALEAFAGLVDRLPPSWYSPELMETLLRLSKIYIERSKGSASHAMVCLGYIAQVWVPWFDALDQVSGMAMQSIEVCVQVIEVIQEDGLSPAVIPCAQALIKAIPRLGPRDGRVQERATLALAGLIAAMGPSFLGEEGKEGPMMNLFIHLLTSAKHPQVTQGISNAMIQCAMQASPCLTEWQEKQLLGFYQSVTLDYLRSQGHLSLFSRSILPFASKVEHPQVWEKAVLDSLPGSQDTRPHSIVIQCTVLSGILGAYEELGISPSSSKTFPWIARFFTSLISSYIVNRRFWKEDGSQEVLNGDGLMILDGIFVMSIIPGIHAYPGLCQGWMKKEDVHDLGQVLFQVLEQHPHCLNMNFLTFLSSSTWCRHTSQKVNKVEGVLRTWSVSQLAHQLGLLAETIAQISISSGPEFALELMSRLDAFVGDTLTDFVMAEKTLEWCREKHSGMVHGIFRCMRLLFVVVIRYASRFEEQAHRLGRLPRGHYDRLVLSMFENLHFLLPTVDMMNEHGSGPILKSYENIMLVIATRLQQAPSDQLSRVFRSLSPPAGAIMVEDSMVRRASRIFFLDLMEQFSGHLEECFLVQTILPILPLYLDKPEFADVFGSTHSLILSLFSQNRECMIPVAVTYSSYLIENYEGGKLNFDQFQGAYGVLMEFLANVHPSMAWYCILSLLEQTRKINPGYQDPQDPGSALQRGPYLHTLGSLVCTAPYTYLPFLLGELERLLQDEEGAGIQQEDRGNKALNEAILKVWEGLSQELGLERKELVIKWWLFLQSRYAFLVKREHHL